MNAIEIARYREAGVAESFIKYLEEKPEFENDVVSEDRIREIIIEVLIEKGIL